MEDFPNDVLFDICSWLPVRAVLTLRQCCKKYQELLLSKEDNHWTKRIESTFPFNSQNILTQDVTQQLANFLCFRTIDTGDNVRHIQLSSANLASTFEEEEDEDMEQIQSGPANEHLKLPWTNSTLLTKASGSLFLFDVQKVAVLAKIDLPFSTMWLDVPNRKVAVVHKRNIRVYSLANNSFEFEYESTFTSQNPQVFPLLANDCIMSFDGDNKVEWYSLKTNQVQRSYECQSMSRLAPFDCSTNIFEVFIDDEEEQEYIMIFQLDCGSENEPKLIIKEKVGTAEAEIIQTDPIENEFGRLLAVYYYSFSTVVKDVFDLTSNSLLFRIITSYDPDEGPYNTLGDMTLLNACPGAQFCVSQNFDEAEIKVFEFIKGEEFDLKKQPYWHHQFKELNDSRWVTTDILNIAGYIERKVDLFYSVSKNRIIGYLEGYFPTHVFTIGGKILAFSHDGSFYIVRLDADANDDLNDRNFISYQKEVRSKRERDFERREVRSGEADRSSRDERSDESSEEPPGKRQKPLITNEW